MLPSWLLSINWTTSVDSSYLLYSWYTTYSYGGDNGWAVQTTKTARLSLCHSSTSSPIILFRNYRSSCRIYECSQNILPFIFLFLYLIISFFHSFILSFFLFVFLFRGEGPSTDRMGESVSKSVRKKFGNISIQVGVMDRNMGLTWD